MNSNQEILKEIKQAVLGFDPEAEVILFGSRARGDFHEESDWDVMIVVEKDERNSEFRKNIRRTLLDLELKYGQVISGVVVSRNLWQGSLSQSPLFWEVQKDGFIL